MKKVLVFCTFILPCVAVAQSTKKAQIAHGKYLVERVGMCGDCHTPHDQQGKPIQDKLLQGSVLPFKPAVPMPWAAASPAIAGLPQWTDAEVVQFLMTGKMKGAPPLPPMPEYKLSSSDAQAVAAYLRSLGTKKSKTMSTEAAAEHQ